MDSLGGWGASHTLRLWAVLVVASVTATLSIANGTLADRVSVLPADTSPIANAGTDQTVNEDTPFIFDGSASTDDIGIVNYTWLIPRPTGSVRTLVTLAEGGGMGVFDPVRPLVYVLRNLLVDAVNLTTGSTDRTFPINHAPQYPMTLHASPRGNFLVVGIPTGTRGYYDFGPYDSSVASIDLANQTKLGEFFVPQDARDAVVSDNGFAVVSGGSGQWADLRVYSARNGSALPGSGSIWQYNVLAMHPSGRRVYGVETSGLSTLILERYDFDPSTGIVSRWGWPHWGSDPGGQAWVSPDGNLLLTGSGMLLALNDDPGQDMDYVYRPTNGPITTAAFDPNLSLLAVAEGSRVTFYDMRSYDRLGERDLGAYPIALAFRGEELYAFVGDRVLATSVPRAFLYGVAPSYAFSDPGTYTVTLEVRDTAGMVESDQVVITVRDVTPPVADAGSDHAIWRGTRVFLDGTRSTDNAGVTDYRWTFTDGAAVTLQGPNVSHVFSNPGTIVVTLIVSDAAGNNGEDTATVTINVDTVLPVADAGPDRTVREGTLVAFEGWRSSDNLGIVSYEWSFQDGGPRTLSGANVTYRFGTPGTYVVILTVGDAEGNVATDSTTIVVEVIPLVTYEDRSHGFRIGIPDTWRVERNYSVGPENVADLAAFGPFDNLDQVTILVFSERIENPVSDAYVLAQAENALQEIRNLAGPVTVVRAPEIIATAGTSAAVFEICYAYRTICQVVAVAADEGQARQWTIIGTAPGSLEEYGPSFYASVRSFTVLPPPTPLESPGSRLSTESALSVIAITFLAVQSVLLGLWWVAWRARRAGMQRVNPASRAGEGPKDSASRPPPS